MCNYIKVLKKNGKKNNTKIANFKIEAKKFLCAPSKSLRNPDTDPVTICKISKSIEPNKYGAESWILQKAFYVILRS